jgi:hypothetical protein
MRRARTQGPKAQGASEARSRSACSARITSGYPTYSRYNIGCTSARPTPFCSGKIPHTGSEHGGQQGHCDRVLRDCDAGISYCERWRARMAGNQASRICHGLVARRARGKAPHLLYVLHRRDSIHLEAQAGSNSAGGCSRSMPRSSLARCIACSVFARAYRLCLVGSRSISKLGLCWARMASPRGPPEVSRPRQGMGAGCRFTGTLR